MSLLTLATRLSILSTVALLMAVPSATPSTKAVDKIVLSVSGKISGGVDGVAEFSRDSLEALGMVTIETTTPWYKGVVKFEGIPLHKLMQTVGANGQRVVAVALNDYSSELPIEDFEKYNVVLALKRDNEYLPVSDKGPLFIVYPYDSVAELRSQRFYSRSVWQVKKLIIK